MERREIFKCRLCNEEYLGDVVNDEDIIEDDFYSRIHNCANGRKGIGVISGYSEPITTIEIESVTHRPNDRYDLRRLN
jgi:hypothetical protein